MSSLLAVLENIVDKNGNVTLLIMREEVLEVEGEYITDQDLDKVKKFERAIDVILTNNPYEIETRNDLTEWMEVNLDETTGEIADTKNVSVLARNVDEKQVLEDEFDYQLNAGPNYESKMEQNMFEEVHAEVEVEMKRNKTISDKIKICGAMTNLPTRKKPQHMNKLQLGNVDKRTQIKKELEESYSYTNPADALKNVSQLQTLKRNTFLIWQQFTKWESGMALCNNCEKGFPAGITTNMIRHMKVNHRTDFDDFDLQQFNGNYMKGTVSEFQTHRSQRKKCDRTVILNVLTKKELTSVVCKLCGKVHDKFDPRSILKHMKGKHKEEFIAFEKEYVLDVYISKALPNFENLTQGVLEDENKGISISKYLMKQEKNIENMKECKCGKLFGNHILLDSHIKQIHLKMIMCSECGQELEGKKAERSHMVKVHTPSHACPADNCKRVFKHQYRLNGHVNSHHTGMPKAKNYSCQDCGKSFFDISRLKHHIAADHLLLRPFECKQCGKTFKKRSHMWSHKEVHMSIKRNICPTCGRGFSGNGALWNHKKLHK